MYLETGGIDDLQIEKHNAFGRSDLEFSAGERYYVLELKFAKKTSDENRMLGDAVKQIKERHYGEQCEHKNLYGWLLYIQQRRDCLQVLKL